MARIRTIKPEFWESERVGRLSVEARLTLIGLISMADDEGRGRGNHEWLWARLHPYRPRNQFKPFVDALFEIQATGIVLFYAHNGCGYYSIPNWSEHQRVSHPTKSSLPSPEDSAGPPEDSGSPHEDSVSPREDVYREGKGKERKGKEGASYSDAFESVWKFYPKKVGKKEAWDEWEKLRKSRVLPGADSLQAAVKRYADSRAVKDGYALDPCRWFKRRRWEDETGPPGNREKPPECPTCHGVGRVPGDYQDPVTGAVELVGCEACDGKGVAA